MPAITKPLVWSQCSKYTGPSVQITTVKQVNCNRNAADEGKL